MTLPTGEPDEGVNSPGPWLYLAAALTVILDQALKLLVLATMYLGQSRVLIPGVLSFTFARNSGVAWGLLQFGGRALAAVAILLVIGILIWGRRYAQRSATMAWGLSLLLGGAVGNLIDRLRLGYVVDFLNFHIWPVFNVADIAIVVGAGLILLDVMFAKPRQPDDSPES